MVAILLPMGSINLGEGVADGINDAGQVVGFSSIIDGNTQATEWSGGSVIDLGGLPDWPSSYASGINNAGQVVGASDFISPPPPPPLPVPSPWAMILAGFVGLGLAGYRRAKVGAS
jgi:probable HAF family extracellular repeat protein